MKIKISEEEKIILLEDNSLRICLYRFWFPKTIDRGINNNDYNGIGYQLRVNK